MDELASRGRPRGPSDVFTGATSGADPTAGPVGPRRRPLFVFAGAFAAVLVVGAVVASLLPGGPLSPFEGSPQVISQDGVILLVGSPSDGGDDALIYGQLIVGEGSCLAVSWAEGGTYPLVFPAGSQLVSGTQVPTVSVPESGNISVGQWVTGGGGYHSTPIVSSGVPEIPTDCAAPGTEVAVSWTIQPEPTTTRFPEMTTSTTATSVPAEEVASSRVVRVVEVRLGPDYEYEQWIAAGPATLILDNGDELEMPAGTPLTTGCSLLDMPGTFSGNECYGVVGIAADGVTVLAFKVFVVERIEPGFPARTLVTSFTLRIQDNRVVLDHGVSLELNSDYRYGCGVVEHEDALVTAQEANQVDQDGQVTDIHCHVDW